MCRGFHYKKNKKLSKKVGTKLKKVSKLRKKIKRNTQIESTIR